MLFCPSEFLCYFSTINKLPLLFISKVWHIIESPPPPVFVASKYLPIASSLIAIYSFICIFFPPQVWLHRNKTNSTDLLFERVIIIFTIAHWTYSSEQKQFKFLSGFKPYLKNITDYKITLGTSARVFLLFTPSPGKEGSTYKYINILLVWSIHSSGDTGGFPGLLLLNLAFF